MILTHGANRLAGGGGNFVEIGGHRYPVIKIGNQLWLAENLDYKFQVNGSQIPIGQAGTPSTSAAWYYNNNETTYGLDGSRPCGLLYNWYAAKYLNDNKSTLLPDGWHVPTSDEYSTLTTAIGLNAGTKLKAADIYWEGVNWNGTNNYDFYLLPGGFYMPNGFNAVGSRTKLWTSSGSTSYAFYMEASNNSSGLGGDGANGAYGCYLRLVKTVT